MSDEWGPWIEHDGNGCPCIGQYVNLITKYGEDVYGIPGSQHSATVLNTPGSGWVHVYAPGFNDNWVVRYRIRNPLAMQMLRDLIADIPHEVELS